MLYFKHNKMSCTKMKRFYLLHNQFQFLTPQNTSKYQPED